MKSENPQSKHKHRPGPSSIDGLDRQRRGATTPRRSPDATRASQDSPSKLEHQRHSRGSR